MAQRYRNIPNSFIEFDISQYIHEQDVTRFTLTHHNRFPFDISFLADQLLIYPKAKEKLPTFTAVYALFSPRAYEQASAEKVALFKSGIFSGGAFLDLSGGLGVDDWAFAKSFKQVDSVDIDDQLNKLVRGNYAKLGVTNVNRIDADAYQFVLQNKQRYDYVYLDADRRVENNRAYALKDTEPNIHVIRDSLFTFTDCVLLKVSPMLDIDAIIKELGMVEHIWIISLKNEVKELLVKMTRQAAGIPEITAVDIDGDQTTCYTGNRDKSIQPKYSIMGQYFYEPSLAIIKSGLVAQYLNEINLNQVAPNSVYALGEFLHQDFFGRRFQVLHHDVFSKSKFSAYLRTKQIVKANIAKRNFKIEVTELRKLFGLQDGGEDYFFFTNDGKNEKYFFHCRKI